MSRAIRSEENVKVARTIATIRVITIKAEKGRGRRSAAAPVEHRGSISHPGR
jgi:hypothetical protein